MFPPYFVPYTAHYNVTHCWRHKTRVVQVVVALPPSLTFIPQVKHFPRTCLQYILLLSRIQRKRSICRNSNISPEIHVSNWVQFVLISSIIEPHIKVIVPKLLNLSASLVSATPTHCSMYPSSQRWMGSCFNYQQPLLFLSIHSLISAHRGLKVFQLL